MLISCIFHLWSVLLLLNYSAAFPKYQEDVKIEELSREKRQSSRKLNARQGGGPLKDNAAANCDFMSGEKVSTCLWENMSNTTELEWVASTGQDAYWVGGPRQDKTAGNLDGGYVFLETSTLPSGDFKSNKVSAIMESPALVTTGSKGHCVTFSYFISGLSPDRLKVLLHPTNNHDSSTDVVLAALLDDTRGQWKDAQVLYTYPEGHKLIFEAIPKPESTQARRYRGFIAVDDIKLNPGEQCKGHCTFDSGLCKFSNDQSGNFEWLVGRGSNDPNTGPQRDHSSFTTNRVTGAFAYIDAGHPRKQGDRALLISEEFTPTDQTSSGPLCLRFWTHMYGNGIGSLNVYVRGASSGDSKIWGLTGDAGNNWYMGQVPIAATENFRIVFEGVVGRNKLGNIALDDISIAPGVCPTAPQVAATTPGDCSFQDDECGWSNPEKREGVDELDWERKSAADGERFPLADHTTGDEAGFYMQVSRDSIQRSGDRAFLVSREMEGSSGQRCLSFWYYMYEPIVDTTGPDLGKLAIWTRTIDRNDQLVMTPVWRVQNGHGPAWRFGQAQVTTATAYQVMIEGIWGSSRASGYIAVDDVTFYDGVCQTVPHSAVVVKGECSFDRNSCGWRNTSTAENFDWRMATLTKRPANLPDKTYGAPVGYAYFDIFNTGSRSNKVKMISPVIPANNDGRMCFSFWFAAFGAGDTTSLRIYQTAVTDKELENEDDDDRDKASIWLLSASELDTARPEWSAGQVTVDMTKDFRLVLEGKASNGGFAIDQLEFNPGECKSRPQSAVPKRS